MRLGCADCKIIGCQVDLSCRDLAIEVGFVGIVDDLLVAMVFHHDEKYMIEMRNAGGNTALLGDGGTGQYAGDKADCCCLLEHGKDLSRLGMPAEMPAMDSGGRGLAYCPRVA